MRKDVECPYCDEWQEIDHDGGSYGYEEGWLYEQECRNCEKTFGYHTRISFDYTAKKVPCFNGAPHEIKESRNPFGDGKVHVLKRCMVCDYERAELQEEFC